MVISKDKVVQIDYTLTDNGGQVLDSSQGRGPLSYIHGKGNLIPGLEKALEGQAPGNAFKVSIPPAEAYGERDPQLVQQVARRNFEGVENLAVGMRFQARGEGYTRQVVVVGVEDDTVTVDGNHPLAGATLNFDVKVVQVRDATEEELAHGHCRGEGGCGGCGGGCGEH